MADGTMERLELLEQAVRRAGETLTRLREENAQLRRDIKRLEEERRVVLNQIDGILKDIARLDLPAAGGVGPA